MVKNAQLCPFYTTRAKTVVTSSSALMNTYEATGPAELKRTFKAREFCPYEALVLSLKEADIAVVTYNYILNEFMRSLLLRRMAARPSELILMIDEAHNLPRLASNLDDISVKTIARAAEEARKYGLYELADKIDALHEKLVQMPIDEEVEVDRKLLSELNVQEIINAARYVQELKLWSSTVPSSYLQVLGDFLGSTLRENSLLLMTLQGTKRRLEAVNLNPLKTTKALFESVYSSISMSGTLSPSEVYAKIAGLPENTLSIRVGYPFSSHNMRVYGVTDISTRYEERKEELYLGIYNVLSSTARSLSILGQFQLGYGTGVFFASHDLLDSFMGFLSQRHLKLPWEEILTEKRNMDSDTIKELFNQFVGAASTSSALLLAVQGARPAQ